ncbi:MAG: efflux transporter periplasmic adaptor subunit [Chloroflexi bacterium]|nr:MAG: efflux transporter periplasmic adaptor subunit [Chloroflexota bacterium]
MANKYKSKEEMLKNNGRGPLNSLFSSKRLWIVFILVGIVLIAVLLKVVRGGEETTSGLAIFAAKRGPLTISVLESGTIKAREQIIIKNEVEGRTSIIWLIDEGTVVKKGDLLVELDASTLADDKIDQEIRVQNADAALINATESLAVVKNQAQSDVEVAELTLEFAKQDLKQYEEGRYPNEKTAAENSITLRDEELKRAEETLAWSKKLAEQKYISKTELLADELAVTRSKNNLQLAQNDLNLLKEFTYQREMAQLQSDVRQATMALERTQRKAKANVAQAEAELKARELEFKRQQDRLTKITDQIAKAKLYAPSDGMVVYATSAQRGGWRRNQEPLDEGVEVRERQELIHLPTTESYMVEVDIHEASLEKVRVGLPAIISVDALEGKKFLGHVARIAPLPDATSMWMNPDLKVYNSDVYLEGTETSLRTGMSCKVEVIAEQYEDAIYVPVQSVLRIGGEPAVFVVKDGSVEERKVDIGMDNRRMIRIISGLDEGEAVMLAPPLKSATIEPEMQVADGTSSPDSINAMKQRINERLEEANGSGVFGDTPGMLSESDSEIPQQRRERRMEQEGEDSRQRRAGRESFENMSSEEREQMRSRFENMSPEERQRLREQFQGSRAGGERRSRRRGAERND